MRQVSRMSVACRIGFIVEIVMGIGLTSISLTFAYNHPLLV